MTVNKVILVGNLGADAELKFTQGGQAVAKLRLCTTEKWTDKAGNKQSRSEWHQCVYWGKGAENVSKFLTKGKQIYVEGRLETRSWDDKDGGKRYSTEIRVDMLQLLGGGNGQRERRGNDRPAGNRNEPGPFDPSADDDIPL